MAISAPSHRVSEKNLAVPSNRFPWIMLFGRMGLFLGIQAVFALVFYLAGVQDAWDKSAAWWPMVVTLANLICVAGMIRFFRAEGNSYWGLFRIQRESIKSDLLALVASFVVIGPAGYFPNVILAGWLFGNSQTVMDLFMRPLPFWAVYAALVLFPVTQGMAELPTYFGYVMPRLQSQGLPRWLAVGLPALMLGLQHLAVPLVLDIRFIAWRGLMFIPFALVTGIILNWRPRLMPYMAFIHILMDLSLAMMLLSVGY